MQGAGENLKSWRDSFGDIQTWRRPQQAMPSNENLKKSVDLLVGGNQKSNKSALEFQGTAGVTSTKSAVSALHQNPGNSSGLDRQKMIDMCDRQVAEIQSEFALLERLDFVDFIHSAQS